MLDSFFHLGLIGTTVDLQDIIKQGPVLCLLPMCTTYTGISIIIGSKTFWFPFSTKLRSNEKKTLKKTLQASLCNSFTKFLPVLPIPALQCTTIGGPLG